MSRARSSGLGLLVGLATFGVSSMSRADDSETLGGRRRDYSSPQNFALEIRIAPYLPQIDENPSLTEPVYNKIYGDSRRIEVAVEFDWQVFRIPHFGTIGPGIAAGYTRMNAVAQRADGQQPPSDQTTSLEIFPFYGVVVLRADVFQREVHIPLVPYAKAGIGLGLWRASDEGTTSVSKTGGIEGKGKTWGTHAAFGLALQLNAFDPGAARALDEETGVNNTYLFGEYMMSDLRGFGDQNKTMWVGTRTFLGGMAFEF